MSEPQAPDPLNSILSRLKEAADVELGPPVSVLPSEAVLRETALDMEILSLAQANLTYVEIARRLDLPLGQVVRRITGMLKGVPLYSEEHLAGYLARQLDVIQAGVESALRDMGDTRRDDEFTEKLASNNRHNGRLALVKLLTHEAAILGLLRQRIDITRREQVNITVIRQEDYDAL